MSAWICIFYFAVLVILFTFTLPVVSKSGFDFGLGKNNDYKYFLGDEFEDINYCCSLPQIS